MDIYQKPNYKSFIYETKYKFSNEELELLESIDISILEY